jgi:hypothetical protein
MNTGKTLGCGIFAVALALALAACPHEPATNTIVTTSVSVESVEINSPHTAFVGIPKTFTATVLPSNATNGTVTWSISGENTIGATINPATGEFSATSAGTVTIVAAAGDESDTQEITVSTPTTGIDVDTVTITGGAAVAVAGGSLTFGVDIEPGNASNQTITWSVVSGPATSNGNGSFTFNSTGQVTIRATAHNNVQDEKIITVTSKIPVQLDVPEDLDISGGMVTWTAVADAAPTNGYTVKIYQPSADTYDEYAVSGTSYSLSSSGYVFTPNEEYWIYVKANGYETTTHQYLESDYCNRWPYWGPLIQVQFATPANLILNGSTLTLSWDAVEDAWGYTVKIFKVTPSSLFPNSIIFAPGNSAVISSNLATAGVYEISVKTDGYTQAPYEYRESDYSAEITHYVGSTGLSYTAINGGSEYEVAQGTATDTDIVILPVYNGVPVTGIANSAFPSNPGSITSVFIPYSVRSIGNAAFQNCTGITALTIPASVTTVGSNAFSGLNGDALYVPYANEAAADAVWGTNWHSGIVDMNRIHYTAP